MTIRQELIQSVVRSAHRDFNYRKFDRFSIEEILHKALARQLKRNGDYLEYWQSLTDMSRKQLRTRMVMAYFEQALEPD